MTAKDKTIMASLLASGRPAKAIFAHHDTPASRLGGAKIDEFYKLAEVNRNDDDNGEEVSASEDESDAFDQSSPCWEHLGLAMEADDPTMKRTHLRAARKILDSHLKNQKSQTARGAFIEFDDGRPTISIMRFAR